MGLLVQGDREALVPIMEHHYQRLYRIALSYLRNADDALEAVQEAFVKAFQNAAKWDQASEVGPWLTRIVINDAIDRYRQGRRRIAREEPLEGDHNGRFKVDEPSPERRVQSLEVAERITRALRSLPHKQRAVFVLRHYEDMSLEEISQTLNISLGTVKSSLHRALKGLRERLVEVRA